MQIKEWTYDDVEEIAAAEQLIFKTPWSYAMLKQELSSPIFKMYTAKNRKGELCGYIGFYAISGEFHIANLAVLPQFRRRGVAKTLVAYVLAVAVKCQIQGLTLEVRTGNTAALALYGAFGFEVKGLRKKYYENTEDAYIMWKYLT